MTDKKRAANNRTLTLTDAERRELRSVLVPESEVAELQTFENQLICGDLLHVISALPNEIADLIIVDPPYNLSKNFHGTVFNAMSDSRYEEYLRTWFHSVCEKLKPGGSLYLCGDWKCTAALQRVLSEELTIMNRITWQREKGRGAASNWKNAMEDIWFAVKNPKDYYFNVEAVKMKRRVLAPYRQDGAPKDWQSTENGNFRLTCPSNFWDDISVPFWSMPENTDHPTQKPEKLYAKLILASSREGDLVFDPFAGSGTTCAVAKKLNRKYLAVEMNEEYCLWTAKRIRTADTDSSIQGYADGVFWERNSNLVRN